jgi:hypothetical protein
VNRLLAPFCALIMASMLAAACGGGDEKVIVNEQVCASVPFVRMKLGEKTKLVLDNDRTTVGQRGMSLRIDAFPLRIEGEQPEGTVTGNETVTFTLGAPPGEEKSVTVTPTFAGNFIATCGIILNDQSVQKELPFQIVP